MYYTWSGFFAVKRFTNIRLALVGTETNIGRSRRFFFHRGEFAIASQLVVRPVDSRTNVHRIANSCGESWERVRLCQDVVFPVFVPALSNLFAVAFAKQICTDVGWTWILSAKHALEIHTMDKRHASTHAATLAEEKWQRRPLGSRVPMRYQQKRNYTAPRGAGPKFASASSDWRSYILLGWRESPWTRVMAHVREPEHAAEI